jgi:hypothetical protein
MVLEKPLTKEALLADPEIQRIWTYELKQPLSIAEAILERFRVQTPDGNKWTALIQRVRAEARKKVTRDGTQEFPLYEEASTGLEYLRRGILWSLSLSSPEICTTEFGMKWDGKQNHCVREHEPRDVGLAPPNHAVKYPPSLRTVKLFSLDPDAYPKTIDGFANGWSDYFILKQPLDAIEALTASAFYKPEGFTLESKIKDDFFRSIFGPFPPGPGDWKDRVTKVRNMTELEAESSKGTFVDPYSIKKDLAIEWFVNQILWMQDQYLAKNPPSSLPKSGGGHSRRSTTLCERVLSPIPRRRS